jgi:CDP-diacylglycerol--serine O-phosphatidyltransferase
MVLPVFVLVILFFALLIAYPWPVLTIGVVIYLASLPFGFIAYRNYERQAAEAEAAKAETVAGAIAAQAEETAAPPPGPSADGPERPPRLN